MFEADKSEVDKPEAGQQPIPAQLQRLRNTFAGRLCDRLSELEHAWDKVRGSHWQQEALAHFRLLAHSLAGAAATFGFQSLGEIARTLDLSLQAVLDNGAEHTLDEAARQRVGSHFSRLRQAAQSIATAGCADAAAERALDTASDLVTRFHNRVFIVDDDEQVAHELARQIGFFGYDVTVFIDLNGFQAAMASAHPAAIIMDIRFPDGPFAGCEVMEAIRSQRGFDVPVIFISEHSGLEARVKAVRAGGEAYFNKPLDLPRLVYLLDTFTSRRRQQPYHVLIVDDDPLVAEHHATILEGAGFTTLVVNDPTAVTLALEDFYPEIILMDLYMPGISGPELAKVIHQQEMYVSVPIIFLSMEDDRDRQLATIRVAGDDFLTKPIQPEHLVSVVSSRAQRYRTLRYYMERDGLTGALNHTRVLDRLASEVARAQRDGTSLVFAMLDLDHFKQVNDSWGHHAGDNVLQSLARMLKQRLRKSDVIGRYGGEEFALILPNTEVEAAFAVLDDIRRSFAEVRFRHDESCFQVTFSCGLVALDDFPDAGRLAMSADEALYEAKQAGRNRVVRIRSR